jgi:hypothetical protein
MKPYKTFRQFLEERGFFEINSTQTVQPNLGQNPQLLSKFGTAVQNMQKMPVVDAISGKNPKAQQQLFAQAAKQGMSGAQLQSVIAPDQARTNEPAPWMLQQKTMRKG